MIVLVRNRRIVIHGRIFFIYPWISYFLGSVSVWLSVLFGITIFLCRRFSVSLYSMITLSWQRRASSSTDDSLAFLNSMPIPKPVKVSLRVLLIILYLLLNVIFGIHCTTTYAVTYLGGQWGIGATKSIFWGG